MSAKLSLSIFQCLTVFQYFVHPLQVEAQSNGGLPGSGSEGKSGTYEGNAGTTSGSAGSSAGSPGIDDTETAWKKLVAQSAKHSTTNSDYAESLIQLGMFYNRHDRYAEGRITLSKALSVIDKGALKPTTGNVSAPEPATIRLSPNGTVSATVNDIPPPYESTMQNLLPALVAAELSTGKLHDAEIHVKKMITIAASGRIPRVPALMQAYDQYSDVLTKMGNREQATIYKNKAEQIRSKIIGL